MPKHKFAVGDRVIMIGDVSNKSVRPGVYTIIRSLPVTEQGCQYRAKNALDAHERVIDERLLRRDGNFRRP